jgi:hypothetical protein
MALDYKVVKVGEAYCVEEKATGYHINTFKKQEDAKKYMKFLNLGGGFAGFTPSFILNKSSKNM